MVLVQACDLRANLRKQRAHIVKLATVRRIVPVAGANGGSEFLYAVLELRPARFEGPEMRVVAHDLLTHGHEAMGTGRGPHR